tara:strand:+ start:238 stop:477 length:240 start_codon:yes stop_codon:yes gene_type:complete
MTNARRMKQMVWTLIWGELNHEPDGHHSNMFDRIVTSMSDMGKIKTDASFRRLEKVINQIQDDIESKTGSKDWDRKYDD